MKNIHEYIGIRPQRSTPSMNNTTRDTHKQRYHSTTKRWKVLTSNLRGHDFKYVNLRMGASLHNINPNRINLMTRSVADLTNYGLINWAAACIRTGTGVIAIIGFNFLVNSMFIRAWSTTYLSDLSSLIWMLALLVIVVVLLLELNGKVYQLKLKRGCTAAYITTLSSGHPAIGHNKNGNIFARLKKGQKRYLGVGIFWSEFDIKNIFDKF